MEPYQNNDILNDFESVPVQASGGKRFANYLIDTIAFYLLATILGFLLAIANPSAMENINDETPKFRLVDSLLSLLLYFLYMFGLEAFFKGKTLGKVITGTRAVQADGTPVTTRTAMLRALSRLVPFEPFSALGTPSFPWHDKWTDSYVIDEKRSRLNNVNG